MVDYEVESSDRGGPRFAEVVNSSLQTPVSVKAGKATKTSRLTKCSKARPQTPNSNVGKFFVINHMLIVPRMYGLVGASIILSIFQYIW